MHYINLARILSDGPKFPNPSPKRWPYQTPLVRNAGTGKEQDLTRLRTRHDMYLSLSLSLSLSLHTYTEYIISRSLSLSLSLYVYIYIYIYTHNYTHTHIYSYIDYTYLPIAARSVEAIDRSPRSGSLSFFVTLWTEVVSAGRFGFRGCGPREGCHIRRGRAN